MTTLTKMLIAPALAAAFVFAGDSSEAEAQGFALSIGGGRGLSVNSFNPYGFGPVSPYYGSAYRGVGVGGFGGVAVAPVYRGYGYSSFRPSYGYNSYRSYRAPVYVPSYRSGRYCR